MKKQFYSKLLRLFLLTFAAIMAGNVNAEIVTDELTLTVFDVSGTSYTAVTGKTATSDAVYSGQLAGGNNSIQLRSNNSNSGIVTTTSGGKVKSIKIEWNSNTDGARTVDIYGKNTAYTNATDLYNSTKQGTKIASFKKSNGTGEATIEGDYQYIGIRSNSGAMYIEKITIVWEVSSGGGDTPTLEESDLALDGAPIALSFDLFNNSAAQVINYTTSSTGAVTVSGSKYVQTAVDETAKTITVTPLEQTPSAQTITVRQDADETYNARETTFTVSITDSTPKTGKWELTNLTDLTADDVFVIVGNNGSNYAMSNDKGTGSAPSAVAVTINNNEIISDVDDNIKWNISGNATDGYTFYPDGSTSTWLYCTNANNGVRVGTNDNNIFTIFNDYLYNTATTRYLGIYNSQDWRCYTSINDNIKDQTFAFFKYVSLSPLESITVDVTNAPTQFHQGDKFSHEGVVVTATYENETTKDVTASATFSDPDMTTEGEKEVTVSYIENEVTKTTTYTINVNAPAVLTGITLSGEYPTAFYVGDEFSYEGIEVTASYDDNTTKDVTASATFSAPDMTTVGEKTVTVSYTDGGVTKTATYDINLSLKPGSEALPYTVAQAIEAIDNDGDVTGVYATGIVSEIVTAFNSDWGNISYNISADGTTADNQLQAYRGKSYNGDDFTSADDIQVGDKVVIYGNLQKYGTTYEFAANNQLVSLERVSLPEVSITDAANATWVAPAKVKITSDDVKVYTVTYDDAVGCTRKHEVLDKVVPANGVVLLTSDAATTVTLENTDAEATDFAALDNDLLGSDGTVQGAANIFCLTVGNKGLGFYPVDSSIKVPAGKAYLLIPATQAAPSYIWFNGDTTAIDSLTTDTAADNESSEIYSLTGQRVGKNYRGIVIMNGRKVLKK